jgi:cytochrome c biogenesis protein
VQQPAVSSVAAGRASPGASARRAAAALRWLASLKLSAALLVALAAAIVLSYASESPVAWSLATPMALLAVNLAAAIAASPVFRRQGALLAFHLALAALAALAAAGQLGSLKGRVELASGEAFAGALDEEDAGPLHRRRLARVAFVNEGFEIDYAPGLQRGETRNRVRYRDESGVERVAVIGDQRPLVLHGYRFYTTSNKGFAPVFLWQPAQGPARRGSVHLPSYPMWWNVQAAEWKPPELGRRLTFTLHIEETLLQRDQPWRLKLPERHWLELEVDGAKHRLEPGRTIDFDAGRLRYEGLTTWMGYSVFSDWTLPWLLAACLVAVASLGWHYWRKLFSRPWRSESA